MSYDPKRDRVKHRERQRRLRAADPKKHHARQRRWRLRHPGANNENLKRFKYGRNIKHVCEEMMQKQAGRCAICLAYFGDKLVIDHDHKTGEVRALLCRSCNAGLGFFKEEEKSLLSAVQYLRQYRRGELS